jgi:hypothetical protein
MNFKYLVTSEVLKTMNKNITIILDVTPCSPVDGGTSTTLLDYKAPPSKLAQAVMLLTCWCQVQTSARTLTTLTEVLVVFLGPSMQIPGYYHTLKCYQFLPNPLQFIIHYRPITSYTQLLTFSLSK